MRIFSTRLQKTIFRHSTHLCVWGALLLTCNAAAGSSAAATDHTAHPLNSPAEAHRLSSGASRQVIVLFDDSVIAAGARILRDSRGTRHDDAVVRGFKRERYRALKRSVLASFDSVDVSEVREYDHLPHSLVLVKDNVSLKRLLADRRVAAVFEDSPVEHHLAYSLPFIGQPASMTAGFAGGGRSVAVLDSGINYTLPAFGSCTSPGIPAGCRVVASVDVTGNNVTLNQTPNNHGTNVAGVVAGTALSAGIAAVNVFSNGSSSVSWVLAGINWAIANQGVYSIAALNMSLGDTVRYTSPCGNPLTNPYVSAINNVRDAGILPVASSGNSAFTNGMSSPACIPGVVSVGAVYDLAWRSSPDPAVPFKFTACTETGLAAADKIPCFSNSASFLTMLAPGAFVTAAGIQMAGTSQAAPHVAAAAAVLRDAYPSETHDQITARMTSGGVQVADSRNGLIKPRLNLYASFTPVSDLVLTVSSSPQQPHEGDLLTYSATVLNNGPFPATAVVLNDTIPAGAIFVSASPVCQLTGSDVTCFLGTLARGASATVNITFIVPYAGVIENAIRVQSATADPLVGNNTSAAPVNVAAIAAVPGMSSWSGIATFGALAVLCLRRRGRNTIGAYH